MGSTYPVCTELYRVRRTIILCAKRMVMGTPADSVLILEDEEVGDRGVGQGLLRIFLSLEHRVECTMNSIHRFLCFNCISRGGKTDTYSGDYAGHASTPKGELSSGLPTSVSGEIPYKMATVVFRQES